MSKYKLNLLSISDNTDIFSNNFDIIKSKYYLEPKLKLGFHHYLHQSKSKLNILNDEKYKNKDFYYIIDKFHSKINDHDEDIHTMTLKYFKLKSDNNLNSFYKMWEIIYLLNLVSNNKSINVLNLSQSNTETIQAIILFRDKYNNNISKSDKYCSVVNEINKNTINCYNKDKSNKYFEIKSSNKLDNIENINNLLKDLEKYKDKADLIISDNNYKFVNKLYEEQEAFKLLIGTFILGLKAQKESGSFICKIYEIFTDVTIKLICIIKHFYKTVYIYKPYTSNYLNTELYLVCKDFIPSKSFSNDINKLEKLFNSITNESQIFDIITSFKISDKLFEKILNMNLVISSLQFNQINKLISYIEKKEYFGEDYHNYREKQIEASKFWLSNFYPKSESDIISKRKELLNK